MNVDSMRIGHGFDVHRFTENFDTNKPLKLAGRTGSAQSRRSFRWRSCFTCCL